MPPLHSFVTCVKLLVSPLKRLSFPPDSEYAPEAGYEVVDSSCQSIG